MRKTQILNPKNFRDILQYFLVAVQYVFFDLFPEMDFPSFSLFAFPQPLFLFPQPFYAAKQAASMQIKKGEEEREKRKKDLDQICTCGGAEKNNIRVCVPSGKSHRDFVDLMALVGVASTFER